MYKYAQFWCFKCKINDNVKRNVEVRVFEHNGRIISKYCYKCVSFKNCNVIMSANFNFCCETKTLDLSWDYCGILRNGIIKPNKKLLRLEEEENL